MPFRDYHEVVEYLASIPHRVLKPVLDDYKLSSLDRFGHFSRVTKYAIVVNFH